MYPTGVNPYPQYGTYLPQQRVTIPYITQPQNNQTQTMQPILTQQIVNLSGRVVQKETDITPQEVAMDGTISLFPLADYTAIIAKQWNSDGTIKTLRFVPEVVPAANEENQSTDFVAHFDKRMDELLSAVKNHGHYNNSYRPKQSHKKQEGESNA